MVEKCKVMEETFEHSQNPLKFSRKINKRNIYIIIIYISDLFTMFTRLILTRIS